MNANDSFTMIGDRVVVSGGSGQQGNAVVSAPRGRGDSTTYEPGPVKPLTRKRVPKLHGLRNWHNEQSR